MEVPVLGGAPTYDFAKFCEELHEIGKILGLNPPLNTTSDLTAILDFETHLTSQSRAEVGGRRRRWLS